MKRVMLFCTALMLCLAGTATAADLTLDFTEDPATQGVEFFGGAEWRQDGGNDGGYLKITDAENGATGGTAVTIAGKFFAAFVFFCFEVIRHFVRIG